MSSSSSIGRDDWDAVADTYGSTTERVTGQFVDRLLDSVDVGTADRVLDVACGIGAASFAAAARGAMVTALDYSSNMLDKLAGRLEEGDATRIRTLQGNAADLQLDDSSCSAAISNFGVIFCPDVSGAIAEMRRVVGQGGRVGLTAWTRPSEHSWTSLLPDDAATQLGFELEPASFYRWKEPGELAADLEKVGLRAVKVEAHSAEGPVVRDAALFRSFFARSPINRANVGGLSVAQYDQLTSLVSAVVEERIAADGQIILPATGWIASGIVQ